MRSRSARRGGVGPGALRGFTLIEMLVTLVVLGIAVGITGLSVGALEPRAEAEVPRRLVQARAQAIRAGQAVTLEFEGGVRVTLRPDGSATPARIWDGTMYWRLDPWTGEVRRE